MVVGLLLGALLVDGSGSAQQASGPRDVVQSAERAVQDDSVATVRARWTEALRRDSSDRAAALGLASLARLTYDFTAAERLFAGILARAGTAVDPWTIQAKLGLYRTANAAGNTAVPIASLPLPWARHAGSATAAASSTPSSASAAHGPAGDLPSPRFPPSIPSAASSRRATAGSAENISAVSACFAASVGTPE